MSHVKFVHWAARMTNSDKLCNSFSAAGANGRLDFSLSLLAACGSVIWLCRMWPWSKELRLAKKSVATWRQRIPIGSQQKLFMNNCRADGAQKFLQKVERHLFLEIGNDERSAQNCAE